MTFSGDGDFFVGWGTLSLINAGLAQTKSRNAWGWWLASLLLGPIATLLIVALPPLAPMSAAVRSGGDA